MTKSKQPLQPSANRHCLVTGGAGFIGSHLVERLLRDGHSVVVLDNLSTGQLRNLASVREHPQLEFHRTDVTDFEALKPLFEEVDWVFHLAALADVVPSIEKPLEYYRANVNGTACVLEAARAAGIGKFLYAASSSCYGIPDSSPTPETADIRPQYPYALTKYLGEQLAMHWAQVYHLPCLSLRLFNVYGPRARTTGAYGAVFGVFLAQKLSGNPFTVVGDGNQTRDFTFVTDVVDAFIEAAASSWEGKIWNVGSSNTYSINSLVSLLGGEVVYIPKRPGEPDCTYADTGEISKALGWRPQTSFEAGVRKMLEHINDWKDAPVWTQESIAEATRRWFDCLAHPSGVRS